jgi:hypothetical protein
MVHATAGISEGKIGGWTIDEHEKIIAEKHPGFGRGYRARPAAD